MEQNEPALNPPRIAWLAAPFIHIYMWAGGVGATAQHHGERTHGSRAKHIGELAKHDQGGCLLRQVTFDVGGQHRLSFCMDFLKVIFHDGLWLCTHR